MHRGIQRFTKVNGNGKESDVGTGEREREREREFGQNEVCGVWVERGNYVDS